MTITKPPRLRRGDTVAVLSPSAGLPSRFPHVYEHGLQQLRERFGLKVKEMPTARLYDDVLYRNPQLRAEDLNAAFADSDVCAIITSIGGDDSVRLLQYLDLDTIRANPKIIMGYSDATTFLTYLNQHGLVTFNGPTIMAGFSQLPSLPSAYSDHIHSLLMADFETYSYQPYGVYTERYADFSDPANVGQVEDLHPETRGQEWLQGSGKLQGRLFGGCIEVLEFLKGTDYWPAQDFWHDKILFFETSEEVPSVSSVKYFLRNYGTQGILERIQGILFGRARGYTTEQKDDLVAMLRSMFKIEFPRPDLPIVANLDFGHTDPQWILPNGALIEIDCDAQTLRLLECPTID